MAVTLPSGRYIIPISRAPEPGSKVDAELFTVLQGDCVKNDVQRFLGYSERSSGELRRKVTSLGYSLSVAESTVNWATEYGLVDDKRFCALFISSRIMGRRRLKIELSRREVPEAVITQALSTVTEWDSTRELVKQVSKRYGHIDDWQTARRRASGWLSRRGFSSEIIHAVLRDAL